ncbi:MAG: glutamyl-tRNA reductase [Bacteroidales bacterium]|jgi:glutamyl-tRNA reductase|nr:glutamyl-tRNA reductase [Bacteroidales bacterium]
MLHSRRITHSACNLAEREELSQYFCRELHGTPHVLLATCNRMEQYWGEGAVRQEIVQHLYRVAAGLESALPGERAIQGQIKEAYARAQAQYRLSPELNRLFQTAMSVGKRVRSETKIAEGAVSHSQITADMLKERGINLTNKVIGIIGINKLTEDILKYLTSRSACNVLLSNRNIEKAQLLANRYNGTAIPLSDKQKLLQVADILICATSAPHSIIHAEDISPNKELLIFDLAFPRDVDETVGDLPHVELRNLEDIELFARRNIRLRHAEIHKAEQIITEEIAKFEAWQRFREQVEN